MAILQPDDLGGSAVDSHSIHPGFDVPDELRERAVSLS